MKKTVVVGMSGGVDSSVSAYLLKESGYNVIGLFMQNWEETDQNGCCTAQNDYDDVRRVCGILDIPHYSVNFSKQYRDRVFKKFIDDYLAGLTPNPDVLCNREIKFSPFLDYAKQIGADYIATGHYAGVQHTDEGTYLTKAADLTKDQTYFLHQLRQEQLRDVVFPLANIQKKQVRQIAKQQNFYNAEKKDSTGICFIGERNFEKFLRNYIPFEKGDIRTSDGKLVGKHNGLLHYTIGQGKGLGIGGLKDFDNAKWFVVDKDLKTNTLIVEQGEHKLLYSKALTANNLNFIPSSIKGKFECYVKIRYRHPDQKAIVTVDGDTARVEFEQPQRAVTFGQYAVFYDKNYCLGGGVIRSKEGI